MQAASRAGAPLLQSLAGVTLISPHHGVLEALKVIEFDLEEADVTTEPGGSTQL
jgi:hypothetical protein